MSRYQTHSRYRGVNAVIPSIASHNPSHKVGRIQSYEVEPTGLVSEYIQVTGLPHTV